MSSSNENPQQLLSSARSGYVVGAKPVSQRKSTKFLANAIRFGFVAVLATTIMAVLPDKNPQTENDQANSASVTHVNASPELQNPSNPQQEESVEIPADFEAVIGGASLSAQNSKEGREHWEILSDLPSVAQSDIPPPQYPLNVSVTPKDTHSSLVVKLYRSGNLFQAAILQAEGLETKPYYIEGDPSQPTIGVGYNIKMSKTAIGAVGVQKELSRAGISSSNVEKLMSPQQSISSTARITPHQALALLDIASKRFEMSSRGAIGAETFNRLPKHRQAALMMIDYNSNLHKRQRIIQAVRRGDVLSAVENMETYGMVNGKRQRLANAALPQHMFYSEDGAKLAVMRPETAKRNVSAGIAPWIDNVEAKNTQGKETRVAQEQPQVTNVAASPEITPHVPSSRHQEVPHKMDASTLKDLLRQQRQQKQEQQPEPVSGTPEADTSWLQNARGVKPVK